MTTHSIEYDGVSYTWFRTGWCLVFFPMKWFAVILGVNGGLVLLAKVIEPNSSVRGFALGVAVVQLVWIFANTHVGVATGDPVIDRSRVKRAILKTRLARETGKIYSQWGRKYSVGIRKSPWPHVEKAVVDYFFETVGSPEAHVRVMRTFRILWGAAERQTSETIRTMRVLDQICEDDQDAADLVHASWLTSYGDIQHWVSYQKHITDLVRSHEMARLPSTTQNRPARQDIERLVDESFAAIRKRHLEPGWCHRTAPCAPSP